MAVNIKGKSYKTVAERIQEIHKVSQGKYSITTEYQYMSERLMWVVKATLGYMDQIYTGLAQEIETTDYKSVNATSALENAETSAIGRALAAAGFAGSEYASADEMQKALNRKIDPTTGEIKERELQESLKKADTIKWTKEDLKSMGEQDVHPIKTGSSAHGKWFLYEFDGKKGFVNQKDQDYIILCTKGKSLEEIPF